MFFAKVLFIAAAAFSPEQEDEELFSTEEIEVVIGEDLEEDALLFFGEEEDADEKDLFVR